MKHLLMVTALLASSMAFAASPALPSAPPAGKLQVPPPPEPPADAPPGTPSKVETEPTVTVIQKGEDKIEEYRLNGRLYMVKVTPKNGVPYYLIDNDGSGNLSPSVGGLPSLSVPQWVIKRF